MLIKTIPIILAILLVSVLTVIGFPELAMPFTWVEVEDAGNLPSTAKKIAKYETLEFITGSLESPTDVDMYAIYIIGDGSFSATTVGWTIDVDTQLTLFDSSGIGIYSNDDFATDIRQSTLPAFHPLTPLTPGIYYLAISDWDYDPVSEEGYIFPHPDSIDSDTAIEGPNGPGGSSPITGWDGVSLTGGGSYIIALTGAATVARLSKGTALPGVLLLLLDQ